MSEQEMNRKMEFIIEQQAQFVADIQELHANQKRIQTAQEEMNVKHNHLTEALTTVVGMVGRLSQGQEEEIKTELIELATAQKRTDERLNIFIDVLERYISEGRNGHKPPDEK